MAEIRVERKKGIPIWAILVALVILALIVWAVTGAMTLLGAFSLCELCAQMPRTGGLYEYLKDIYGAPVGFLYGWANFTIAGSGGIAATGSSISGSSPCCSAAAAFAAASTARCTSISARCRRSLT